MQVTPEEGGLVLFPPLPKGTYRVLVGDASPLLGLSQHTKSGVLNISTLQKNAAGKVTGLSGILVLDRDLPSGRIEVGGS